MKSIIYNQYGAAQVLQIAEIPKPIISNRQVLVKVEAAGLNPKDSILRNGDRFAKILTGNKFPKQTGFDFSGTVVEVGKNVSNYKIGDEVFGFINYLEGGTLAEYLAIRHDWIALKPKSLSHVTMASIPCAYLTALQVLRDIGKIEIKKKVLIYGASGGVGTAAIQLASYYGADITSVSSSKNLSYCKLQGAGFTLAYDKGDIWNAVGHDYDLIFEVFDQGGKLYKRAKKYLKKGGVFVTLSPNPTAFLKSLFSFTLERRFQQFMIRTRTNDLLLLGDLVEKRQITPQIQTFKFHETIQAFEILDSHHSIGKIVIEINK